MKAATCNDKTDINADIFQSTPPVKAATRNFFINAHAVDISIHAAREGGDCFASFLYLLCGISIHAAREGGDVGCIGCPLAGKKFQSTPPVKAATKHENNQRNI